MEVAAELHDVVAEEFSRLFPEIKDDVSIKLIHTQEHLLSTYDRQVSEYAEANFERTGVELMLHTRYGVSPLPNDGVPFTQPERLEQ